TRSQHLSETTAQRIDAAIAQIITAQYTRGERIIAENREALDKVARALIEHETIEGKHVMEILRHGEIKSPVINAPAPVRAGGNHPGGQARDRQLWRQHRARADPGMSFEADLEVCATSDAGATTGRRRCDRPAARRRDVPQVSKPACGPKARKKAGLRKRTRNQA
ncbi:MAG: hypothetical protein LBC18_00700, partial [Opitutaceae bacterium]|nr:hypothetical protein [Opitutaceae bacterium]